MKNYVLLWHDSARATGGIKAKEDTNAFFKQENYQIIDTPTGKIAKVLYVFCVLPFVFFSIRSGNIIVQFPSGKPFLQKMMLRSIKYLSGANLLLIIHDIEALRIHVGTEYTKENKTELQLLKLADGLVSLNKVMTKWLRQNEINVPITELRVWDYINPAPVHTQKKYAGSVCFAGNLDKSEFLYKYDLKHTLTVFGKKTVERSFPNSINYAGVFTPEELPSKLNANFGLIWDGNELTTCAGNYGTYLRYNAPHKTSLYLSSGLPVIVWKEAAVASVIEQYKCGLTIESLTDLDRILDELTPSKYEQLYKNTVKVAEMMRQGTFMKTAIESLISKIEGKNNG